MKQGIKLVGLLAAGALALSACGTTASTPTSSAPADGSEAPSSQAIETVAFEPGDVVKPKDGAEAKKPASERRPPEYGSAKDFPLLQALAKLKGEPVKVSTTLTARKEEPKTE